MASKKLVAKKKTTKPKISPKIAFILSLSFLLVCVAMLFLSVSLTSKSEIEKAKKSATQKTEAQGNSASKTESAQPTVKTDLPQTSRPPVSQMPQNGVDQSNAPIKQPITSQKLEAKYKIYIILDDGGHNLTQLQPFMQLSFPLAVAVLPKLSYTEDACREIVKHKKILMLHQPMQAINRSVNPGPGAIEPEFSDEQIRSILKENISQLDNAAVAEKIENGRLLGMNNHEGSLITENPKIMKIVLEVCKEKNLFFLDSRTNSASVCREVASELGMQIYERNIFLDNEPNQENMIKEFRRGVEIARKNGSVIMIGHVWSGKNLADVLQKMYDEYSSQGFEFVSFGEKI